MTDTDIATILNAIGEMRSDFDNMKVDVNTKIGVVQQDIASIKVEMGVLKTDIAGMKTDIAGMKTDIAGMKTDMEAMNTDIGNIVEQHEADMRYIRNCLDGLNGQVRQQ